MPSESLFTRMAADAYWANAKPQPNTVERLRNQDISRVYDYLNIAKAYPAQPTEIHPGEELPVMEPDEAVVLRLVQDWRTLGDLKNMKRQSNVDQRTFDRTGHMMERDVYYRGDEIRIVSMRSDGKALEVGRNVLYVIAAAQRVKPRQFVGIPARGMFKEVPSADRIVLPQVLVGQPYTSTLRHSEHTMQISQARMLGAGPNLPHVPKGRR